MPKPLAFLVEYFPPNPYILVALIFALAGAFFVSIYFIRRRK